MYITLIIFIFILIIQIILGFFAWRTRKSLPRKYHFILGNLTEVSTILEKYKDKHKKLVLKATSKINVAAFSEDNFLLINKHKIYSKDLYSNFYTLFQLYLTEPKNSSIRKYELYQNAVFFMEFVFVAIGLIMHNQYTDLLLGIGVFFQIFEFILNIIGLQKYGKLLDKIVNDAKNHYLVLDKVEEARLEALASEIKYEIFEYPFEILWRIGQYLK